MKKDDEQEFGSVTFLGEKFILRGQADHTSRLLSEENYMDRANGVFQFEMSAPARSDSGEECLVYWIFRGDEDRPIDSYDYDSPNRVEFY